MRGAKDEAALTEGGTTRILYVDDESPLLELAKIFLERQKGFEVATFVSPNQAFKELKANSYDAIIADYQMPEMNGIAFLKKVRSELGDIPFILFTGKGREEVVIEAINNGADSYLQKGGAPEAQFAELAHRVRQAVTRRRAEEDIQDSLFFLNALIDQSPYPIWISDEKGSLIRMNAACERLLHTSEAELVGRYNILADNIVEEQGFVPLVKSVFEQGQVVNFTINYDSARLTSLPLGETVSLVLEVTIFPIRNAAGRTTNAAVIHNDITERKRAEEALADSERRYRTVFETAEEGIWIIDSGFRTLSANRKMQDLFGYTEQEMVGRLVWEFAPPDEAESMRQELSRRSRGEPGRYERRWVRKDGTVIWCLTSATPLFGADREFLGSFGMFTDITERRKAEEALRASERKYRLLAENINDVIWTMDISTLRFTFVTPSVAKLSGFTPEETMRLTLRDLLHPDSYLEIVSNLPAWIREFKTGSSAGAARRLVAKQRTRDGSWLDIEVVATLLPDERGEFAEILGVTRSIADRVSADVALSEANRKLNLMSSITGHDINNQMIVIDGLAELCRRDEKDPGLLAHLDGISRAAAIVKGQIEFTRVYQELGIHAPVWSSFGRLARDAFSALHPPGVTLEDGTDGIEVLGDSLIEKVPYNLIDNSVRHGGHVSRIRIAPERRGDALLIVYQDDGVGIGPEEKAGLFRKGDGGEAGYGLLLIRDILAITGMTITEDGRPGEGARFEIMVPPDAWRQVR